jgi:hypothetical protein
MNSEENMKRYERLLLELPDFILGKTPESVSREIQQRIEQDPDFRAEYEALRKVIQQVENFSETAFERSLKPDIPPFYFESLAERVQRRLKVPRPSLWERCVEVFQTWLHTELRYQLAGALAGIAMAVLMILAVLHLDTHIVQHADSVAQRHRESLIPNVSIVSAMQYAESLSPELLIDTLSEEEAKLLLETLMQDITEDERFKVLSDEEVKILMQLL